MRKKRFDEEDVFDDDIPTGAEEAPEEGPDETWEPPVRPREIVATNRAVRMGCALAASSGPAGLFLLWAERESRAIRRFAVQSAALMLLHLAVAAALLLTGWAVSGIPPFRVAGQMICWLLYISALVLTAVVRVRMTAFAWRGEAFYTPLVGRRAEQMIRP